MLDDILYIKQQVSISVPQVSFSVKWQKLKSPIWNGGGKISNWKWYAHHWKANLYCVTTKQVSIGNTNERHMRLLFAIDSNHWNVNWNWRKY